MSMQEVQKSGTTTDDDGNMLINNGYRPLPALDDFQNESTVTRMKAYCLPYELYQHRDKSMYEELGEVRERRR